MGKIFLKLVKRYFPKENPLHKIFNKNTVVTIVWAMQHPDIYKEKSLNLVAIVGQRPIAHLSTNAWLSRLFTKQILETILMMRRNFELGFLRHLLRNVLEITKTDLLIRSMILSLNCQNLYDN